MVSQGVPGSYDRIIRLWVLRVLVAFGGHKNLIGDRSCNDDTIMEYVGLGQFCGRGEFDPGSARAALWSRHEQAEARGAKLPTTTALARNIQWLEEMAGLSPVEAELLHFNVLRAQHSVLESSLAMLGNITLSGIESLFAKVLGLSIGSVRQAIQPDGKLSQAGLVRFELRNRWSFENKVEMLPGLADSLSVRHRDPYHLFSKSFIAAPGASLEVSDYPHLSKDLQILGPFLREALASRRPAVNVLIHGLPGGGKTQFTRMLAKHLDCTLFEVATDGDEGEPLAGELRFRSYRLSQAILRGRANHLILFDEVEDVFRRSCRDPYVERGNSSGIKGWINRMLEGNPVPAFWVTNSLESIDSAFIRRFDYVLEIGIPPRSVRAKILDGYLADLPVSSTWKASMAEHEQLTPAVVERAAKVVQFLQQGGPEVDSAEALARVMGNTLEAMGCSREPRGSATMVTDYRPEVLNTDCDLAMVKTGLLTHGQGRLCLFGPPGTGKTAFGRHIAEVLDRPLIVKRASDLQSMWVGQAEKNLARMFKEAGQENAVLLLDEADSFLQDRKGAQRSWEISQVNEMLTQMEAFEGVFIASTNLMNTLDEAAMRRFDLKIRFDYLKAEQAWLMFQDMAKRLDLKTEERDKASLRSLSLLTPGDFANVVRQTRLRKIESAKDLVTRLAAECEVKPEGRRKSIGF
jgi:SpoVK/Ycf46/Vps4 family AAA+-type ATPase